MTSPTRAASTHAPNGPWLHGPTTDLLLGAGLIYVVVFGLLAVAGSSVEAALPLGLTGLIVLFTGLPHYGATLLRVYERPEDRRRYARLAIGATVVLIGLLAWGTRSIAVGSWMLTAYLTWSPWHYAGQNYGVAMMMHRRHGVDVSPRAQKALRASFMLSFGLVVLALHGSRDANGYVPLDATGSTYAPRSLGLPAWLVNPAVILVAAAYVGTTAMAALQLLRNSPARRVLPGLMLVGSQALWFVVPMLARHADVLQGVFPLAAAHGTYTFFWIAVTHSIQYLWVTTYFQRRSPSARPTSNYYVRALLLGSALWIVPALVFAPKALGGAPYDGGLSLLVASAANLHHFILDGAIWKLRKGKLARILLRGQAEAHVAVRPRLRWAPKLVWAAGAVSVAIWIAGPLVQQVGVRGSLHRGNVERAERAYAWLARIGQHSVTTELELAASLEAAGETDRARARIAQAVELADSAETWTRICALHAKAGRNQDAITACARATTFASAPPAAIHLQAYALTRLPAAAIEQRQQALRLARRAVELDGDSPRYLATLAIAYHRIADTGRAIETAEGALRMLRAQPEDPNEPTLANDLAALTRRWQSEPVAALMVAARDSSLAASSSL